ncbi:cupin domain-containing protein [Anaeroselena agilis]|uniref:Cupin domain-containing protein n=1 Tax=Anaeroselena agilis TaxID=3063788 RepID=A0ABU3NXN1_9FIRM|nr:cupin domain-containing protein [Selenomonadales bacterium 4137-cl]
MEKNYGHMQIINLASIADNCREKWANFTLSRVNGSLVRLGIFEGEFHWHKHDREDEFFFVVSGEIHIDLAGETVNLKAGQGYTVTQGVSHRTRADRRATVLMVEADTVNPRGD